jgi:hypothetical protein
VTGVPVSLWNHYQVHPRIGAALGVLYRSDMYAAIDNTVTLPGYARADAALHVSLTGSCGFKPTSRISSTSATT